MPDAMTQKTSHDMYADDLLFWNDGKTEYMLSVEYDDDAEDPRKDASPVTCLFCRHPRRTLGDYSNATSIYQWWRMMITGSVPADVIFKRLAEGRVPGCRPGDPSPDGSRPETADECVQRFIEAADGGLVPVSACQAMLEDYAVFLPVWIYEHSGATISAGERVYPYNDTFDSAQLGWILAMRPTIEENYNQSHDPDFDWKAKAMKVMQDDIALYDHWVSGDVFWYRLYSRPFDPKAAASSMEDDWDELDSCTGFYGTDIMSNGIAEHAAHGCLEALKSYEFKTGTKTVVNRPVHEFHID